MMAHLQPEQGASPLRLVFGVVPAVAWPGMQTSLRFDVFHLLPLLLSSIFGWGRGLPLDGCSHSMVGYSWALEEVINE